MFQEIYEPTWQNNLELVYRRLIEELAELAESVRFNHLYPKNFENELADFFAWWFAISILTNKASADSKPIEQLLWEAYPAQCVDCNSMPCFCPPRPVRELMSKPAPGQFHKVDALTSLHNQGAYTSDIDEIGEKQVAMAFPIACVRIDVDDFKQVNDKFGHPAGDEALKHIAAVLRKKARMRDRLYRVGGDEFGAILVDCTEEESYGLMKRVAAALQISPVRWVSLEGNAVEFNITTSIGVAECSEPSKIKGAFEAADTAAYASKKAGKNTITRATGVQ
jgi:diguanylate cyclase (GGDEF)-like protein